MGVYRKNYVNGYYAGTIGRTAGWTDGPFALIKAETGKAITRFIYEDVLFFEEGLCPVKYKGKWGLLDEEGKTILPCVFEKMSSVYDGKVAVIINGEFGIIDLTETLKQGELTDELLREKFDLPEEPVLEPRKESFVWALRLFLEKQLLPDGRDYVNVFSTSGSVEEDCTFATGDFDEDGAVELLIEIEPNVMAAMTDEIYGYNEETGLNLQFKCNNEK